MAKEIEISKKYKKEQILKSKKYSNKKSLLNVLLESDKDYTIKEIDTLIDDYMNKEVK